MSFDFSSAYRPREPIYNEQGEPVYDHEDSEPTQLDEAPPAEKIFQPNDPLPIARAFVSEHYNHPQRSTLINATGCDWKWDNSRYAELPVAAIRQQLYQFLEPCKKWVRFGDTMKLVAFAPKRSDIDNAIDAIRGLCYVKVQSPQWLLDDSSLPDPRELIVAKNGIIRLKADGTIEPFRQPTPLLFCHSAIDYEYDPKAPPPFETLKFIYSILHDDIQSIEFLQEWAGYIMTADTRQQKALMLVGPPRSGKGTLARLFTAMVGIGNVCGPTLSGLATNFGCWTLIGKQLAIISDARLSGRTDQAIVTERLLSITGEDSITIDRKNLPPVTTKLSTRFMVLTNELPRLSDSSGALANRFIVLELTESFLGREDTTLTDRLLLELPGLLNWAIEGWKRLRQRGYFIQPDASVDAIDEMKDLASPISAFVRDWCQVKPGVNVLVSDLFDGWCAWCHEQGRDQAGNVQVFGRNLRAAIAGIRQRQLREDGGRNRAYEGIDLTPSAKANTEHYKVTHPRNGGFHGK